MALCGGCHDINRARAGYTPEGWHTVMRMMLNFGAPVSKDQVETLTDYLIKSFPERPRPAAVIVDGPVKAKIKLWQVPTPGSRPHDPLASKDGAIWYTGQLSGKLGRLDPKTGEIKEYPLKTPQTGPHGLVEDKDGNIWFTGNHMSLVGKLDPKTGNVTEYKMPDPKAKDPHTIAIDQSGIVWFTAQNANMLGRIDPKQRRGQAGDLAHAEFAPLRPRDQLQRHSGLRGIRHQQDRDHRSRDHGDQGIRLAERGLAPAPARAHARRRGLVRGLLARLSRPARSCDRRAQGMAVAERAAIAALRHRRGQGRASGTTNPSPSRTPSCASIRRRRSSRAGRSPAAATSCATWMSPRTAIP